MVSMYEVAEYLRLAGGKATTAELRRVFGVSPGSIMKAVQYLESKGWVKVTQIPIGNGNYTYLVELTKWAYMELQKWGVESFYDIPYVQARREWFIRVRGRDFIDFSSLGITNKNNGKGKNR